jgi:diguanylate cyclase (GGDEF)-like protein/PAS domain S-box-containing protein
MAFDPTQLIATLLTNVEGDIISWNPACQRLFGQAAARVMHQPLASLIGQASQAAYASSRAAQQACAAPVEVQINAAHGTCDASFCLFAQHDEHGNVVSYSALFATVDPDESESAAVGRLPLSAVIDVLPGTFYILRADGSFVLWNKRVEQVAAMSADEVRQSNALDMVDLTEKRIVAARIGEVFENNTQALIEVGYLDKHGHVTPYLVCGARIEARGQQYLCGMGIDISDRRAQEDALRVRERAMQATSSGLIITRCAGADNLIEYVNPAFLRITGYDSADILGRDPRFMADPGADEAQRELLRAAIRERREARVVFRNRRKNGEVFWNELAITPVTDTRSKVTHFVGVINDVTESRQRTALLEHTVNHDPLTGLANRHLLADRLEQAVHLAQRNKTLVAIVLINLKEFKRINEENGHETGDEVLRAVARRLQAAVRESDSVARLTADDFALVLVNQPSLRYTSRMLERLRLAMAQPIALRHGALMMGASMGASMFPHDGANAPALLRSAELAMAHAKEAASAKVHFFSDDMRLSSESRQKLDDELQLARQRGQLFLQYQPMVSLRDGTVVGIEALLRWRHPEHGVLLPPLFLAEAEDSGAVLSISEFVLEQGCALLRRMAHSGMAPPPLAINVGVREFSRPHYVEQLAEQLARYGVAPAQIVLELLETGLSQNRNLGVEVLTQLRELGVQRSLDSFGDGLADLNYLQTLPLTQVKVSEVAIGKITAEARTGVIVRALIDVARVFGFVTIAKGVETAVQADFLRANRCDAMQGCLINAPLGESELLAFLQTSNIAAAAATPR